MNQFQEKIRKATVMINRVASACMLSSFALAGCGNTPDDATAVQTDVPRESEPTISAGMTEGLDGAHFGALAGDVKLAEVVISSSHFIEFWQVADGSVSVIESYNVDENPGPKLGAFNVRRAPLADLYKRVSGEQADSAMLARLEAVDAARRKAGELGNHVPAGPPISSNEVTSDATDDGLVDKGAAEDWRWFQDVHCTPRRRQSDEDMNRCFDLQTLSPGPWTVTWNVPDFETANIALFNAGVLGKASLYIQGVTCSFLELPPCNGLRVRSLDVPTRFVSVLTNTADDGFKTTATGPAIALHYMFWE
jgi:hypothetical protein